MAEPRPVRVGVVTSGGDAPGMNACVRAIVKGAASLAGEVTIVGIRNGGLGLLRSAPAENGDPGDYVVLTSADVANTLHRSGTILKSARESKFREHVLARTGPLAADGDMTTQQQFGEVIGRLGAEALRANNLDGLILIGGDTTSRAAFYMHAAMDPPIPMMVIPASIDNDIDGTEHTIGFDSAVAMAIMQVDALRETAAAMDRIFVVEVMGRDQGHLAVEVALATGAEDVLVPEREYPAAELQQKAERLTQRVVDTGSSALVIVAEGARLENPSRVGEVSPAQRFAGFLERDPRSVEVRVTILGHTLRGAPPTAMTRNLATRSGLRALEHVVEQARSPKPDRKAYLLGMHNEGFLEKHELNPNMVRRHRHRVLAVILDEIERLAY